MTGDTGDTAGQRGPGQSAGMNRIISGNTIHSLQHCSCRKKSCGEINLTPITGPSYQLGARSEIGSEMSRGCGGA